MSLQDDYYDVRDSLEENVEQSGEYLKSFERIWFAFCDYECREMVTNGELSEQEYFEWRSQVCVTT